MDESPTTTTKTTADEKPPIVCTNCNARAGEPCTQPTDNGRRAVSWHHLARVEA